MIKFKKLVFATLLSVSMILIGENCASQRNREQLIEQEELKEVEKNAEIKQAKAQPKPTITTKVVVDEHPQAKQEEYSSLEEVINQMDYSMEMCKPCGLSKEDFVKLMNELPYDYTGFYSRNAEFIWEMEQKYQINGIFFCGIVAIESGWGQYDAGQNNYTGYYNSLQGRYEYFESEESGIEETFKLLDDYWISKGKNTLHTIAPGYIGYSGGTWDNQVYSAMRMIVSD